MDRQRLLRWRLFKALALRAMADRLERHEARPEELLNVSFIAA